MRSTSLARPVLALSILLPGVTGALAQQTPPPPRPMLDIPRADDPNAVTLAASLRAGYQIRAAVQTVEANPLIFIQKDNSARICRAPIPREGTIAPRYTAEFGTYRCSEIK
jgi:hypothetical protein